MNTIRPTTNRPRADRLALGGLRLALSLTFAALGWGLLSLSSFADGPPRFGPGPVGRLLLGLSHLAVGAAFLAPSLAGTTAWLGAFVVWATVPWLPADARATLAVPCLLTLALMGLGVAAELRRRKADTAWRTMLARYAENPEPGRRRP